MAETGKVQGRKLLALFEYLIEKQVIISMHIEGTDFERLTCVTGLKASPTGGRLLCIDRPAGFVDQAAKVGDVVLKFNFNGPDRLEYIFTTRGVRHQGRELETPLPEVVERIQRRKDFRMETPPGVRLLVKQDKLHAILDLINVSLGGAFTVLRKHNLKNLQGSLFKEGQPIVNAGILVPAGKDYDEQVIIIQKAEVRRIEHDKPNNRYRYAFQFTALDSRERHKLTQAIYHFQRQFLKRR
ncbi:PilZ domain-containing protein [Desulfatitalea alkaliphila]|uniref:PilZ domain-containing protein n=1 Tax=Desulfatitalea alkaliphila TaxID=2929485 RepID=A0AA41UI33_9BACT|nr:PilZ domain-containing protein [Desulfatitalea alkaliphila]MCJ8499227.1 PilZ domain-containing protein [Desulfatitalea alkaliphila]